MGWLYFAILLEFFLVLSNVGTGVVLYPIARRQNEALAIGYVAARIIESVFIAVGIIFVLGLVTMRPGRFRHGRYRGLAEGPQGLDVPVGPRTHRSVRERADSRLSHVQVGARPRRMAWLGLIGGPILFFADLGILFDWWDGAP